MKVVSLNTWGGRAGEELLLKFFREHRDVDIFCLQEVWSAPYSSLPGMSAQDIEERYRGVMTTGVHDIAAALDDYQGFFRPHHLDNYGLMIFVKKGIEVIAEGDVFVHKDRGYVPVGEVGYHARSVQFVTVATPAGLRTIVNFHGLWNGLGKGDSEDRLVQSDRVIEFLKTINTPYLLCGDFNLLPESISLKKFEDHGLRNLVSEHGVSSTRTSLYTKPERFADYAFVTKDLTVRDFVVLPDEVSDHSPLAIEIE